MEIIRDFTSMSSRYFYDNIFSTKAGFAQVDTGQDAWYFGTWASPDKLTIVSYIEGDLITEIATDSSEFVEAMRRLKVWNEESGHGFEGIDPGFNKSLAEKFKAVGLGDMLH